MSMGRGPGCFIGGCAGCLLWLGMGAMAIGAVLSCGIGVTQ